MFGSSARLECAEVNVDQKEKERGGVDWFEKRLEVYKLAQTIWRGVRECFEMPTGCHRSSGL